MLTIETTILKGLMYDETYARKVHPYLKEEYFDGFYKDIYNSYNAIFEKYNTIPTMESILHTIRGAKLTEDAYSSAIDTLQDIYKDRKELPDTNWLFDETQQYCQDKMMYNTVYEAISVLEGNHKTLTKDSLPKLFEDALAISFDSSIGSDYFEDWERRYDYYTNDDVRLHFPLKALERLTNGGLPPKTLSCVLATTNTGKSALMCFLAGEWLKEGKNVLYITMEMSEEAVQERIDANMLDVTTNQLKDKTLSREWFKNKVSELKKRTVGRLMVKEYPTSSAHAGHFRHLLREYKLKKKFVPDVIFIDYINICASSRYKSMNGVNSYSYIKAIAEELRGLAVEFNVPIFTGTQTNRDAANNQNPGMEATSESFGLPMSLDFFFSVVTNESLMEMGRQIFHLLKTRFGNKANVKAETVKIDFDKMRYSDIDDNDQGKQETVIPVTQKPEFNRKSGIPEGIDWGDVTE